MDSRTRRRAWTAAALVAVAAAGAAGVGSVLASDHQDTPLVELNPQFDVNDVYAFPAATGARMVLVLGTSSPITPAQTPTRGFGTKDQVLYQLKVDNNGDALEDFVFQATFTGPPGNQQLTLVGPVRPPQTGTRNALITSGPTITGPVNQTLGSPEGVRVFAGPRDDPFFIDLEQFFRILPDRRPAEGPLSQIPEKPSATSFRPAGQAVDFVRGFNDMAIVIELPTSMLTARGDRPRLGIWGTSSRARTPGA
jgi:hypothetical protein